MDAVDGCLEEWQTTWSDMGYAGRDAATAQCKDRYADAIRTARKGESACADGVDNDRDRKVDCEDADCSFHADCGGSGDADSPEDVIALECEALQADLESSETCDEVYAGGP